MIEINKQEILPGTNKKLVVNIAKLPSHTSIDISINVAVANEAGPVILLMGGLHGDEINGIEIVRRIIENNIHIPIKGTIICIPIINIYGFIYSSRYVPDGKDVNRSFPGNKNGSLAARVAHYLMHDIIPKIDYGLDFHTGGADRTNYPQIRCLLEDPVNKEIARAFQAPFTLNASFRPKSLRHAASKLDKHMVVYEGGESSRFDEFAIQQGINGTIRMLNHFKMASIPSPEINYNPEIIKQSTWIRAKVSGLFQPAIKNGDFVKQNQIVGHITDPFGESKIQVKTPNNGFVISLNNNPILHQGDAIMHIGNKE